MSMHHVIRPKGAQRWGTLVFKAVSEEDDCPPTVPPVNPDDDPLAPEQGYLNPGPQGVNARHAWTCRGGDGRGVTLVDIERGWDLSHPDLAGADIERLSPDGPSGRDHGAAVLRILVAADNDQGGVGIVPRARVKLITRDQPVPNGLGTRPSTVLAILAAMRVMEAGDILLLELQGSGRVDGQLRYMPVEVDPPVHAAIRLATSRGVIVVEPAGNGNVDLDAYRDDDDHPVLRRGNAGGCRDSGAILVAASRPVWHDRHPDSNYGSRVDCFAWGEGVVTGAGAGEGAFGGTSSAAAIIAGAAAALQGIAQCKLGRRLLPNEIRAAFSAPEHGTLSRSPEPIGTMPDLERVLKRLCLSPLVA